MSGAYLAPRTLKRAIEFAGVGLHSGKHVCIRVSPPLTVACLPASSLSFLRGGIVFRHPDVSGGRMPIHANAEALDPSKSMLCTQLRALDDSWRISTVEHLMAALVAARVSHAIVDLLECDVADHVVEMPILDGSALPFIQSIQQAGITELSTTELLPYLRVKRPVQVLMQDKAAWFLPIPDQIPGVIPPTLHASVEVNYHHKGLGSRHFHITLSSDADANLTQFKEQVAPARTFTFEEEIAWMQANNLALGGSLENAVVFKDRQDPSGPIQVLNQDRLRFPEDEWVRHKLLDCLGDLGLVGMPVHGHFVSTSPGHALTHRVIQELFADPANYEIVG